MARPSIGGILAMLFAGAFLTDALAQTSGPVIPEPCGGVVALTLQEVDARLAARDLIAKQLRERRTGLVSQAPPGQSLENWPELQVLDRNLRETKEELLDLLFVRECVGPDREATTVLTRGPADPQNAWIEVTAYYATNRNRSGDAAPSSFYGAERTNAPGFGRVVVSIPTTRERGSMTLPSLWKLELQPDARKHFILKSITPLEDERARDEMTAKLASGSSKAVLVFVHGYNVTFADAALRAAQLAHDLNFNGLPILFSWPSAGRTRSYWRDEDMVQLSESAFDTFLDQLAGLQATEVYVVAHSMGNRLVTAVLRDRASQNKALPRITDLLLAAPDINAELFRERIAPALARLNAIRRTIYASSGDVALQASKVVHEFRRVGETSEGVLRFSGFETIDASGVAPLLRAFGHSYVVDSAKVLGDIQDTITLKFTADERMLERQGTPPDAHWVLR